MEKIKLLEFRIHEHIFGIRVENVLEVGKVKDCFIIPTRIPYFLGLFNQRGNIFPLVDISPRCGLPPINMEKGAMKNFILVKDKNYRFGIVVDEILGIKAVASSKVMSKSLDEGECRVVEKIVNEEKFVVSLINPDFIIDPEDFKFQKRYIFKTVEPFEEEEIKEEDKKDKKSFLVFKFCQQFYGVEAIYIKQLVEINDDNFRVMDFEGFFSGELEFEKAIIPVFNLSTVIPGCQSPFKGTKDCYVAVIEYEDVKWGFLTDFSAEFLEFSDENILKEENFYSELTFISDCIKMGTKIIKIINMKKFYDFLKKRIGK